MFIRFKSPSAYGMNTAETVIATSIDAYEFILESTSEAGNKLKKPLISTRVGFIPEYLLSWRKVGDQRWFVYGSGIDKLSRIDV